MDGAGSFWNWLGGLSLVVIVGVVVTNGKNVGSILNGLAYLYGSVAAAATGGKPPNPPKG